METLRKVFAFSGFAILSAKFVPSCENSGHQKFYHIEDDITFCKKCSNKWCDDGFGVEFDGKRRRAGKYTSLTGWVYEGDVVDGNGVTFKQVID